MSQRVVFTRAQFGKLEKMIERVREESRKATDSRTEGGFGQDGWHDEGFKQGIVREHVWETRLAELLDLRNRAAVVDPIEQDLLVKIGNGVVIEYESGLKAGLIIEGFQIEVSYGRASVDSPLGRSLLGAFKGEVRMMTFGGKQRKITILEIYPPSRAEEALKVNGDDEEGR